MVARQLGSLRLPAGAGEEEQEEWRTPTKQRRAEADRGEAEGVGLCEGEGSRPCGLFVCRRRFLATQATAELRAPSLLSRYHRI